MFALQGRKVAITGATGFVGSQAALELLRHGASVCALVRASSDIRRLVAAGVSCKVAPLSAPEELARALEGAEIVIHAAGAVGFDYSWDEYTQVNVQGTQQLLVACRRAGVRRLVYVSSIVAVGASETPRVLDERMTWNLEPYEVPYITTKRWGEEVALAANGCDCEVVAVNPASVVGPDDFTNSEFGAMCKRFWNGRLRFCFGGGNNFVDVRDVAMGIRAAAERGRPGERYLLSGENRTYPAFLADLAKAAGRPIARFQLPLVLAPVLGQFSEYYYARRKKTPYFSRARAAMMGLYFYFSHAKASEELGYCPRPLRRTIADTHTFWMAQCAKNAA